MPKNKAASRNPSAKRAVKANRMHSQFAKPQNQPTMPPPEDLFNGITTQQSGEFLRQRRKELGLRHEDVATLAGLPNANYQSNYERGINDLRGSIKYLAKILHILHISPEDARKQMGITQVLTPTTDNNAQILGMKPIPQLIRVAYYGSVSAAMPHAANGHTPQPKSFIQCPVVSARQYNPEDLFVLDPDGYSMTSDDVNKRIPEGAHVLFVKHPGPRDLRNGDIVAAFIPELDLGVLKQFIKKRDSSKSKAFTLESYHPEGARFPAREYPQMKIQGIALGMWLDF